MTQEPTDELQPIAEDVREEGPIYADRNIVLKLSQDKMTLLLDYPTVPADLEPLIYCLRKRLQDRHVPEEWIGELLEQHIQKAVEENGHLHDVAIVQGEPIVPPVDGYIEWASNFFKRGFHVDEATGTVDYRRRIARTSVEAGELLATVVLPISGQNGRDVYGRMVPAPKGFTPSLSAGTGVREAPEERKFFASTSGRIRMTSNVLSVDEVYVVEGNVGLATGNITHNGAIVIKGDIESGSDVKARGDIEVHGLIENSDVLTGGNLTVHGGIVGKGKDKIIVAGWLHAHFIVDSEVEAGKDIIIDREILNSEIKTRGALAMQNGRLVGGRVTALAGVLVGQTGTDAGIPTCVIAGRDFRLQARIDKLNVEIDKLEDRGTRIKQTVEPILHKLPRMSEEARGAIETLLQEAKEIDLRVRNYTLAIERLRQKSKQAARPRIEISKVLYPDTILQMGPIQQHMKDEFKGPCHAVIDKGDVQLRFGRLNWGRDLSESLLDELDDESAANT